MLEATHSVSPFPTEPQVDRAAKIAQFGFQVYSPPQVDKMWLWAYTPYSIYLRGTIGF